MSNTKLNPDQKSDLKALRACQPDFKFENNGVTTVVYREAGNTVEFTLSVASPNEKKFRAKVGEYYARMRADSGETVKMLKNDFYNMLVCMDIYTE